MAVQPVTWLWSTFTAKAELIGAAVMRTPNQDTAASLIREAVGDDYACTASVRKRFPRVAAQARAVREVREVAPEVVAPGEFAIAETGSVLLDEPPDDRARCFLAERLWLLVPEQALVATLDDALARLGPIIGRGAGHPVIMSGPSRTADIERVLTIGVHGPRSLVVIVLEAD